MKKITIAAVMATLFSASTQAADNGTITFFGLLGASTCNVTVGQGNNNLVAMPLLSAATLDSAGKVAGQTPFNITVSGCSNSTSSVGVKAYFERTANTDASGRLTNLGNAGNVQLELLDGSKEWQPVNIGDIGQQDGGYVAIAGGNAVLPYAVRYYATGAATPGTVSSSATFNLIYQ